jgi:class 3 adenylate cyclase
MIATADHGMEELRRAHAELQQRLDEALAQRDESEAQKAAIAEVLGVINSSPGDLAPVFDAILEKALNLCEGAFGSLARFDGDAFDWVATLGVPEAWFAEFRASGYRPAPGLALYRFQHGGEDIEHVVDISADESGRSAIPDRRRFSELTGARTAIWIALRQDRALRGALVLYRREVRPFSDKQITLLHNFAAQAVIAMENARLLGELRDRTRDLQESLEYQTATSDVLKVISRSTFDLQPVLETVAQTASQLCESEMVFILQRDGDIYRISAAVATTSEATAALDAYRRFLETYRFSANRDTLTGRVMLAGAPVQIPDVTVDPEYRLTEAAALARVRTQLGVPLMREGSQTGAMILSRQRVEPYTDKQIELVRTFADQAVIALENARLLGELRQRTEEIAELNRDLEARVAAQVDELGRVGRLKRFLAPQLAELIVSQGDEKILESHRREIVVVFCDLRGYTAFTETAEPEEVLDFLREYHGALGPLVSQFEGTLDQFSGDGIMVFFNDPVPISDPAERAVKMAMAMREAAGKLIAAWRRDGCELGFGAGIAQGYATLGQIGFSERSGYTAIGTVCNLAARLCAEAKDGQILISSRVARAVEAVAKLENLGNLELKGLRRAVAAFNVVQSSGSTDARPNLTVVGKGPGA